MFGRRRVFLVIGGMMAAMAATAAVAFAAWCWDDPLIGITAEGRTEKDLTIDVGMDSADIAKLSGPVDVVVSVPSNVKARLKFDDDLIPEKVTFVKRSDKWTSGAVVVNVTVQASSAHQFPVAFRVQYLHNNGTQVDTVISGQSNERLKHVAYMKPGAAASTTFADTTTYATVDSTTFATVE